MKKTALEVSIDQHTKQIDGIQNGMDAMLDAINGLRADMASRGEKMMNMLHDQNTLLIKNQTDHEAQDSQRFSDIKTKMAYYIGGGTAIWAIVGVSIAGFDLYLRH